MGQHASNTAAVTAEAAAEAAAEAQAASISTDSRVTTARDSEDLSEPDYQVWHLQRTQTHKHKQKKHRQSTRTAKHTKHKHTQKHEENSHPDRPNTRRHTAAEASTSALVSGGVL